MRRLPTRERPDEWVRLKGEVTALYDKSIGYRLDDFGGFSTRIFIPRSQLELMPQVGDRNILVKGWLAAKNNWRTIPVKVGA